MVNPKLVSVFCGVGFILSFLIGLISGNPFLTVLIRAFVSCLCFGAIAAAGSFAYSRFLNVKLSDVPESTAVVPDVTAAFDTDNEALTEDNGPGFYVDEASKNTSLRSMKTAGTGVVQNNSNASGINSGTENVSSQSSEMTSLSDDEVSVIPETAASRTVSDFKAAEVPAEAPLFTASSVAAKESSDELDELPEIASVAKPEEAETVESIIDSDDGGTKTQFVPAGLEEIASSNDASVMASAIRTVLSSDN